MPSAIDVRIVNPFLQAVVHVLKTAARLPVTPGRPYLKEGPWAAGDVTGTIVITSRDKKTRGSIAVSFPERCALFATGSMLGETMTAMNDDVRDAVGELTNMISGQARMWLAMEDMSFDAALPEIDSGQGHEPRHVGRGPILALGFKSLYGPVTVEVCFADQEDGPPHCGGPVAGGGAHKSGEIDAASLAAT